MARDLKSTKKVIFNKRIMTFGINIEYDFRINIEYDFWNKY